MNNRFKFRIFEYETKEMIELDAVGYSSFDPFAEGKSRLIMIPSGLGNTFHYDKQCLYDNDKFSEPMQCTGLHDKNGKLIYEGDIIQIPEDWDTYGMFAGEKREVYFNEGGFRLKPKWDKNSRGNWLEDTKDFEVIGNIYENKELLNE